MKWGGMKWKKGKIYLQCDSIYMNHSIGLLKSCLISRFFCVSALSQGYCLMNRSYYKKFMYLFGGECYMATNNGGWRVKGIFKTMKDL